MLLLLLLPCCCGLGVMPAEVLPPSPPTKGRCVSKEESSGGSAEEAMLTALLPPSKIHSGKLQASLKGGNGLEMP